MSRSAYGACFVLAAAALTIPVPAFGQDGDAGLIREIDDCGVIVRGETCFLLEVGGGRYVVDDFGGYELGEVVRVVGTIDETCITICADADGCIRGAVLYNPVLFPCGTPIGVQFDPCAGLGTGLLALSIAGFWTSRRARGMAKYRAARGMAKRSAAMPGD